MIYYVSEWEVPAALEGRNEAETAGLQQELDNLFQEAIRASLEEEQIPVDVEVELLVVNDDAIREMNLQYRELDRSTDVLSFPLCSFEAGKAAQQIMEQETDPETGAVCLGDIVLSWDHIVKQAEEYGHSIRREAAFLVIHSMLHLFGYDHMEPEEESVMIALQKRILEKLGLSR